jgi:hypothetical protein
VFQDKQNKMGFTTTFLALGEQANRLLRSGERVCLVTKTRYLTKPVSDEISSPETTKEKGKKKAQKTQPKKTKAPRKKKAAATTAKEAVEDLSDDFDDVVEVVQSTTMQYPLIPISKSSGRYEKYRLFILAPTEVDDLLTNYVCVYLGFPRATWKRWRNCSRTGERVFATISM